MENKPMISETEKREALKQFMAEKAKAPVCVAFSGGVDSSLILKLACDTAKKTGMPVYAVTFHTMLHPACDLEIAERVAKELGAIHKIIQVNEMELEAIRTNPVNRCYICKHHLFATLLDFAKEEGIPCVMDGTNESDLHVYRPGIQALRELGVVSPLAQCGLEKKDVKAFAADLGISVASRPSMPCMATRLPYGTSFDMEVLKRIEKGEDYLRSVFGGNVRLRLHGDIVRIEVDADKFEKAIAERETICRTLKEMGFLYITLDLEGFRSGSMDIVQKLNALAAL